MRHTASSALASIGACSVKVHFFSSSAEERMEIGGMIDTFIESEDVHREPLHVLVTAKVTPARLKVHKALNHIMVRFHRYQLKMHILYNYN